MSHQETYRHNEAYAQFLAGWDAAFYAKYADTLKPSEAGRSRTGRRMRGGPGCRASR
jgi:hypothetical protein